MLDYKFKNYHQHSQVWRFCLNSINTNSDKLTLTKSQMLMWTASTIPNIPSLCMCVKSLSHVRLFATLWTVARQAPLFMGFSRQEYWSGSPFPSPGIFPTQGSNLGLLLCRQTLYPLSHQGSPYYEILLSNQLLTYHNLDESSVNYG